MPRLVAVGRHRDRAARDAAGAVRRGEAEDAVRAVVERDGGRRESLGRRRRAGCARQDRERNGNDHEAQRALSCVPPVHDVPRAAGVRRFERRGTPPRVGRAPKPTPPCGSDGGPAGEVDVGDVLVAHVGSTSAARRRQGGIERAPAFPDEAEAGARSSAIPPHSRTRRSRRTTRGRTASGCRGEVRARDTLHRPFSLRKTSLPCAPAPGSVGCGATRGRIGQALPEPGTARRAARPVGGPDAV